MIKVSQWSTDVTPALHQFLTHWVSQERLLSPPIFDQLVEAEDGSKYRRISFTIKHLLPFPTVFSDEVLYHGTHVLSVGSILMQERLKPSTNALVHEFTVPGVYTTPNLPTALWYGTQSRLYPPGAHSKTWEDWNTGYIRFVFEGRAVKAPIKTKTGSSMTQVIFEKGGDFKTTTLHVYIGQRFRDKSDLYGHYVLGEDMSLTSILQEKVVLMNRYASEYVPV